MNKGKKVARCIAQKQDASYEPHSFVHHSLQFMATGFTTRYDTRMALGAHFVTGGGMIRSSRSTYKNFMNFFGKLHTRGNMEGTASRSHRIEYKFRDNS